MEMKYKQEIIELLHRIRQKQLNREEVKENE